MKIWNLWEHQKGWGHNLNLDWDARSVIGHLPNPFRVSEGDELRVKMVSGKVARLKIENVRVFSDPPDMLKFKLKDLGYVSVS